VIGMGIDGTGIDGTEWDGAEVAPLPRTGDQQVDEALEPLVDLHEKPLVDQVEVYAGAHRALQDRLAGLDA
jgi:hypothetical protein